MDFTICHYPGAAENEFIFTFRTGNQEIVAIVTTYGENPIMAKSSGTSTALRILYFTGRDLQIVQLVPDQDRHPLKVSRVVVLPVPVDLVQILFRNFGKRSPALVQAAVFENLKQKHEEAIGQGKRCPNSGYVGSTIQEIDVCRLGCFRNEVEAPGFNLAAFGAWFFRVEGNVLAAALLAGVIVIDMVAHE